MKNNQRFLTVLTIGVAVLLSAVSPAFVLAASQGTGDLPGLYGPCLANPITISYVPCETVTSITIANDYAQTWLWNGFTGTDVNSASAVTHIPDFSWNGFVGTDVYSASAVRPIPEFSWNGFVGTDVVFAIDWR